MSNRKCSLDMVLLVKKLSKMSAVYLGYGMLTAYTMGLAIHIHGIRSLLLVVVVVVVALETISSLSRWMTDNQLELKVQKLIMLLFFFTTAPYTTTY